MNYTVEELIDIVLYKRGLTQEEIDFFKNPAEASIEKWESFGKTKDDYYTYKPLVDHVCLLQLNKYQ